MIRKQKQATTIDAPEANKTLRRQIESIRKQKMVGDKVVSLSEFRTMKQDISNPAILVVDDEEIMRNAIKRILESQEYRVVVAEDGIALSTAIDENKFSLILLDVNLPWVDGYELCRLLKANVSLRHIPLILISARKTQEDIQKGFDAGCNDFVTKPFEVDHILASIEKQLLKSG